MLRVEDIRCIDDALDRVVLGDAFSFVRKLPDASVDTICTSPPFWQQRDYDCDGQYGLEGSFHEFIDVIFRLFEEMKRVLKPDGTAWVNIGDCYNENTGGYFSHSNNDAPHIGKHRLKTQKYQKQYPRRSLLLIPYRFGIRMIDDGQWLCRNVIIWRKKIVQPTTAQNRFTIDFEPIFLFAKKPKYHFNIKDVKWIEDENDLLIDENDRRERRTVWDLDSDHQGGTGHKAPYPLGLVRIPILASCPKGGVVLDPFLGSGTTAIVAAQMGCRFLGCDLNENCCKQAESRLSLLR